MGYQFDNYGNGFYGDSSVAFRLAVINHLIFQHNLVAISNGFKSVNAISQSTSGGAIQSYIAGARLAGVMMISLLMRVRIQCGT